MPWYCLRDLKRPNAKQKAYQDLSALGFRVFTPLRQTTVVRMGRKVKMERPVISDLLFVEASREDLDPVVAKTPTLQYRYVKGGAYQEAMTVPDVQMESFIRATREGETPLYYHPGEINPAMYGRRVRIIGGPLDGVEGRLVSVRGKKTRRVLLELPGLVTMTVEVTPDLLSFI